MGGKPNKGLKLKLSDMRQRSVLLEQQRIQAMYASQRLIHKCTKVAECSENWRIGCKSRIS
eukprot:12938713-Prorocentrum_lima.AAC.1